MIAPREKFSSQADPELLAAMRQIARNDGRHFQAVLEDAMSHYIESRVRHKVRPEVMAHYQREPVEKTSPPLWGVAGPVVTHDFPTLEEVVAIHDAQIDEFGGSLGLRDAGALESAIMRPQLGYYDGLLDEAAALLESLAMNHPFVDGNKRTAFLPQPTRILALERPFHRLR